MTTRLFKNLPSLLIKVNGQQTRYGYIMRGKHPLYAKSLKQRLEELKYKDPEIHFTVDIGLPISQKSEKIIPTKWMKEIQKNKRNPVLEKKSRNRELSLDLEEVNNDWWTMDAPKRLRTIAEHYGIFRDLYGDAHFHPMIQLEIDYDFNNPEYLARVHRGNILKPSETQNSPSVSYKADKDSLWTLLLTTPDGVFTGTDHECCHWFVGNIPGDSIEKGEKLVDYLRPIPSRGIGYCRYIFVLYKQDRKIDFSEYKQEQPCLELVKRNWSTYDFYKKHQDVITPASLAFFQSDWDPSLTDFYHNTLNMREPTFEYDFPKPHVAKQKYFPKRQPFDIYMNKYRDPKEINREYLIAKLKKVHPFKEPEPPLKYPNAQYIDKAVPTWLMTQMRKDRLGKGRINEIED